MKKAWSLLLCGMLFIVIASACSNASAPANPSNETTQDMNNTTTDTTNEATTPTTTDTESSDPVTESSSTDTSTEATDFNTQNTDSTSSGSMTEKGPIAADSVDKRPTYLPTDFPIPDDAVISTSHQEENDGKKSVLLIFTTKGSMETLSQTYKQYFDTKSLTEAGSTIDEKNLIIQGTDPKTKQVWSLIGGTLSGKDVVQLTLTWSER